MTGDADIASALDALHTPDVKQLEKAYTVLRESVGTPIHKLSPKKPIERKCNYTIYDLERIIKFNSDICRVVFAGDPRVGAIFNNDLDNLINLFNRNPKAKEHIDLLFQHGSVLALINKDNIMQFIRRMPLTATEVILANKNLHGYISSFKQLVQIIQLVPSFSSAYIYRYQHLITNINQLQTINRLAPMTVNPLLKAGKFSDFVTGEKLRAQMLEYAKSKYIHYDKTKEAMIEADTAKEIITTLMRYQSTENKKAILADHLMMFKKLRNKDPVIIAEVLYGNLSVCADILSAINDDEDIGLNPVAENSFDNSVIARTLINRLNEGLERNDVQSVIGLATIHLGLPPLFEHRDAKHYRQAEFYIELAKSLISTLDDLEQDEFTSQVRKLEKTYERKHIKYQKQHPEEVVKYSLTELKRMEDFEQNDFDRYLRCIDGAKNLSEQAKDTNKRMVLNEFLGKTNYETLIRYALNSETLCELCTDPRMTEYWNTVLQSFHKKPSERGVLGFSFREVLSGWLYDHYKSWEYAREPSSEEATELLDEAASYGSALALHRKYSHLFARMKVEKISMAEKTELKAIAKTLRNEHFTFGSVVAGLIYLNLATFAATDEEEAQNLYSKVYDSSECAKHFEENPESMRLYKNIGTNTERLLQAKGVEFTNWDEQKNKISKLQQQNLMKLMGFPDEAALANINFGCAPEVKSGHQISFYKQVDSVSPYQNLRVPKARIWIDKIEKNLNKTHLRVHDINKKLKVAKQLRRERDLKSREVRGTLSENDIVSAFKRSESAVVNVSRRLSY